MALNTAPAFPGWGYFIGTKNRGIPSMSHQWVTIQVITPTQDKLARMAQLRRERNQRGDTTPYRHGTDRETGKHVIQALKSPQYPQGPSHPAPESTPPQQ